MRGKNRNYARCDLTVVRIVEACYAVRNRIG